MSIELQEISKSYGAQKAVDTISFSIDKGEIVGFLGPNGAGKSTTMKLINGYLKPDTGTITVDSIDLAQAPLNAQGKIGYLPEHNPLYLDMYVKEYLQFCARIYKVSKDQIPLIIEKVGLGAESHKKIKQLSKGYRQRVGLAAALLHNPSVLILDEPTTGLDPHQLVEIRSLIKEIGKDKTVLFSTHIMQEVEALCDRVIVINKGQLVADKQLKDLKSSKHQIIEVAFDLRIEEQFVKQIPHLVKAKNTFDFNWELTFDTQEDMASTVFDFAKNHGLKILQLQTKNTDLETLFRSLTK